MGVEHMSWTGICTIAFPVIAVSSYALNEDAADHRGFIDHHGRFGHRPGGTDAVVPICYATGISLDARAPDRFMEDRGKVLVAISMGGPGPDFAGRGECRDRIGRSELFEP